MKKIEFEIKSLDDALNFAAKELRVNKESITIESTEKKSMLGFKKSYEIVATVNVDPAEIGFKTLKELFENMNIEATIEMRRNENFEVFGIDCLVPIQRTIYWHLPMPSGFFVEAMFCLR